MGVVLLRPRDAVGAEVWLLRVDRLALRLERGVDLAEALGQRDEQRLRVAHHALQQREALPPRLVRPPPPLVLVVRAAAAARVGDQRAGKRVGGRRRRLRLAALGGRRLARLGGGVGGELGERHRAVVVGGGLPLLLRLRLCGEQQGLRLALVEVHHPLLLLLRVEPLPKPADPRLGSLGHEHRRRGGRRRSGSAGAGRRRRLRPNPPPAPAPAAVRRPAARAPAGARRRRRPRPEVRRRRARRRPQRVALGQPALGRAVAAAAVDRRRERLRRADERRAAHVDAARRREVAVAQRGREQRRPLVGVGRRLREEGLDRRGVLLRGAARQVHERRQEALPRAGVSGERRQREGGRRAPVVHLTVCACDLRRRGARFDAGLANLRCARVDLYVASSDVSSTQTSRAPRVSHDFRHTPTPQRRRARRRRRCASSPIAASPPVRCFSSSPTYTDGPSVKPQRRRRRRRNYYPAVVHHHHHFHHFQLRSHHRCSSRTPRHLNRGCRRGYSTSPSAAATPSGAPTSTSRRSPTRRGVFPLAVRRARALPHGGGALVLGRVREDVRRPRVELRARAARDQQGQRLRPVRAGPARAARAAPRLLRRVPRARLGAAARRRLRVQPPAGALRAVHAVQQVDRRRRVGQPRVRPREPAALARVAALAARDRRRPSERRRGEQPVRRRVHPILRGCPGRVRPVLLRLRLRVPLRAEGGKPVLLARNHNNPAKLYAQLHAAAAAERPTDRVGGGVSRPLAPRRSASCGPRTRTRAASSTRSSLRTRRSSSCRTPSR